MPGHEADADRSADDAADEAADQAADQLADQAANRPAAPVRAADLPAPVRSRTVALVAGILPDVTPLPPALRSVAGFAAARRARAGERAILAALDDAEFRTAAGRLAARAAGAETADRAAAAWLTDADDAAELLAEMASERPVDAELARTAERLRGKLEDAEQRLRADREQHQATLAGLKAENVELRRRLGSTRADERAAREQIDELTAEIARLRTAVATGESEGRRLREQLQSARDAVQSGRAGRRAERDDLTVRTRLLLDALVDTASGLRRELALPTVPGNPADRLEAELADARDDEPAAAPAGQRGPTSPALLDQLLALPRARLIIDGYNVSMAGWPDTSLERQRQRLLTGLAGLVARTGAETTVVFDAHGSGARPVFAPPRGVRVIFTPSGVIADDVIRDLVDVEPAGRQLIVVTSDQEVVADVRRSGARTVPSDVLVALINRSS